MPAEISLTELKWYEEITPPHTIRPKIVQNRNINSLSLTHNDLHREASWDVQTVCCKWKWETWILHLHSPKSNLSYSAYLVNGLTIETIKRVRTLCQGNIPFESITIEEALRDFLTLITKVKSSEWHENQITVLIGHNSATFEVPTLLRNSDENFKDGITDMNVYFADSLHLMKKLIKTNTKQLSSILVDIANQTKAAFIAICLRNNMTPMML